MEDFATAKIVVHHTKIEDFAPDTVGQNQLELLQIMILKLWWNGCSDGYRFDDIHRWLKQELIRRLVNADDKNGTSSDSRLVGNSSDEHEGGSGVAAYETRRPSLGIGPCVRLVDAMPFLHMLFVHSPHETSVHLLCASRMKVLLQTDTTSCLHLYKDERWAYWLMEMLLISGDNTMSAACPFSSRQKDWNSNNIHGPTTNPDDCSSGGASSASLNSTKKRHVFEIICFVFADLLMRAIHRIGTSQVCSFALSVSSLLLIFVNTSCPYMHSCRWGKIR
jgi:hypothetical protein